MSPRAALTQDYRATLLRFLPRRSEHARALAYELGRRAYAEGLSVLEVCRVHNEVALEALHDTRPDDVLAVSEASAELLLEVLAAYDMTHPGVPRNPEPARTPPRGGHDANPDDGFSAGRMPVPPAQMPVRAGRMPVRAGQVPPAGPPVAG